MSITKLNADVNRALCSRIFLHGLFSQEKAESLGFDDSSSDINVLKAFLKSEYKVTDFVSSYKVEEEGELRHSGEFVLDGEKYAFGFFPAGGQFYVSK